MIGRAVDLDHTAFVIADDAGDVFVKFGFPMLGDEGESILRRENDVEKKSGVGHEMSALGAFYTCG